MLYQLNSNSWRPSLATLAVTSIVLPTTYCLYQCVSQYGWEGTYWYIWEGDPYPPDVRQEFHSLEEAEDSIKNEEWSLDRLEEAYERAQLDSVDGSPPETIAALWNINLLTAATKREGSKNNTIEGMNLEKTIAKVSYNLDKLAVKVDSVPSKKHKDLKPRKKYLSNQIVQLMQRADIYVLRYKDGQAAASQKETK